MKFGVTGPYKDNPAEDIVPETPDPSNHPIDADAALPTVPAMARFEAAMLQAAALTAQTLPSLHPESSESTPPSGLEVTPSIILCQSLTLSHSTLGCCPQAIINKLRCKLRA